MNRPKTKKLNQLLTKWPSGTLLTTQWLSRHGYYKQLVKAYRDSGWVKAVGQGAYLRLNDALTWQGAVQALQRQLKLPVHVGGLSSLQLYGIMQYVPMSKEDPTFYLYNTEDTRIRLPVWFRHHFKHTHLVQKKLFQGGVGISEKSVEGLSLSVSLPERAVMEVLALVPHQITLSHANELFEGLDRLRPALVQELLEACCSIKVKRLFLYLSDQNNLSLLDRLELKSLNLGSGKRMIGKGGDYDSKWGLSLEKDDDWDERNRR